jgi:hypothetical protein
MLVLPIILWVMMFSLSHEKVLAASLNSKSTAQQVEKAAEKVVEQENIEETNKGFGQKEKGTEVIQKAREKASKKGFLKNVKG